MSGTEVVLMVAALAATLVALLLTAAGVLDAEIGLTAVSVFATLGLLLIRKGTR
ncbi:MAG: hypothetical protein NXH83_15665 [Rhodobacteraceae bacterium]|nr:hypothetical protein [Paracoccaceae bacterium]